MPNYILENVQIDPVSSTNITSNITYDGVDQPNINADNAAGINTIIGNLETTVVSINTRIDTNVTNIATNVTNIGTINSTIAALDIDDIDYLQTLSVASKAIVNATLSTTLTQVLDNIIVTLQANIDAVGTSAAGVSEAELHLHTELLSTNFVTGLTILTTSGANLNCTLAAGVAMTKGNRTDVTSATHVMIATKDNYFKINYNGVVSIVPVTVGAPAPSITTSEQFICKITTNGTGTTATLNLSNNYRINESFIPNDGIVTRHYTDGSITPDHITLNKKIDYASDYSGTYVARSATDKGYVDGAITAGVNAAVTGTATKIPKFSGTNVIGNSLMNDNAVTVSIGIASGDSKAALQVDSTTQGFLPPRMTTTQRNAITSPPTGMITFDTTTDTMAVKRSGEWAGVSPEQYKKFTVTSEHILQMCPSSGPTVPLIILAAPGASKINWITKMIVEWNHGTTVYTDSGAGVMSIKYGTIADATSAAGLVCSTMVTVAANRYRHLTGTTVVMLNTIENTAITMLNSTDLTLGDGTMTLHIYYQTVNI